MSHTTYEVRLSKDGNHSVTVTTDNQAETQLAIAWAKATFGRLVHEYESTDEQDRIVDDHALEEEPPVCAIHRVPMVQVKGKRGEFWSCHEKNEDGSWCSYRPKGNSQ